MNRAALYVRVSTNGQEEDGYSLDEQVRRLKLHCEAKDWEVVDVYRDVASGGDIKRPGVQALIANVTRYDMVLVYKLDRLSRSQKDTLYLIEDVFSTNNIAFTSLSENLDTSTAFGKAMVGILSVFAQLEREQIKERMTMGKLGRVKNGKTSSWSNTPFGYDYVGGELVINDLQATVVRYMFDTYIAGTSLSKLVDILNKEGHLGKDRYWSYTTVRTVLTNIVYTGRTNFRGEVYEGIHEPVITDEVYEKTQDEIIRRQKEAYDKSNHTRPFQAKYLLSGLLRCGGCGERFELIQGAVRKNGTRSKRYRCLSLSSYQSYKRNKSCSSEPYSLEELENLVLDEIEKLRLDPDKLSEYKPVDNSNERAAIESELESIKQKLERITILFINGDTSIDFLNKQKSDLLDKQEAIQSRLEKLSEDTPSLAIAEAKEVLAESLGSVRDLDYEDQKRIVRALIERITLTGDEMLIKWRFV